MPKVQRAPVEVEDQRSNLLRLYVTVAWAVLVVLAVVTGLVYRRVAKSRLALERENAAYAVAQQFTSKLWPQARAIANRAAQTDPAELRADPEIAQISAALTALADGLPRLVEARVYGPDGTVLFATAPDHIGDVATDPVVIEMLEGRYYGRRRPNVATEVDAALVTTRVAIRADYRDVEAVLALKQDAAPGIRRIATIQALIIGGGIGLSSVLGGVALRKLRSSHTE